ncbi:MAG: OmpA family protein [Nitrospirae bacterium]|nr:OmpA family protein [Nitrospirota bacterium]
MVFGNVRLKIIAVSGVCMLLTGLTQSGCSSMSRTQQGVIIGGLGGAATGALIGGKKSSGTGALIGGILGAASGGLIGNYMDKQAQELASVAEVQRTDDGIRVTMRDNILFDTGQSALKPESRLGLIKIADVIKRYNKTEVAIIGHTDNVGSATYNQDLSERRANSVEVFLINQGVQASRLKTIGMGFDAPVESNDTPEGRALNRRVELHITPDPSLVRDAEAAGQK